MSTQPETPNSSNKPERKIEINLWGLRFKIYNPSTIEVLIIFLILAFFIVIAAYFPNIVFFQRFFK